MTQLGRLLGPGPAGTRYSHRVSCPVVKRRDDGYWLWCYGAEHGFPQADDTAIRFPMGRTGAFRSPDGVHWTPVVGPGAFGSVLDPSDDPDAFDSFQVGGNDVVVRDGECWLYYMGARNEIFDYHGARRQGRPVQIGLARSADGLAFTKARGDADGGAVLGVGADDAVDAWFCAFPRILALPGGGWRMYYTGVGPRGHGGVMVAESPDGVRWEKRGSVFGPNTGADTFDAFAVGTPHVIPFQGGYLLAYEALAVPGTYYRIGVATSPDGLRWQRVYGSGVKGAALDLGGPGAWDERAMGTPYLVAEPDGSLKLYYVGFSEQIETGVGLAVGDASLRRWEKVSA